MIFKMICISNKYNAINLVLTCKEHNPSILNIKDTSIHSLNENNG